MMTKEDIARLAQAELAKRELAKRHFSDYVKYTDPKYTMKWFHEEMANRLNDVETGKLKKLMLFVPAQHGKALSINELCFTAKGWKKHGELQVGDYVFGHDGKPKMVLGNSGAYKWPVSKIIFNDGNHIIASPEHEWKVMIQAKHKFPREEVICETKDVFNRKNIRSPCIDIAPALEMPEANLPIDPYILGLWLGNGESSSGKISFNGDDIDSYRYLGSPNKLPSNCYEIKIDGLRPLLSDNNLINNKHIPIKYLLASIDQRTALLQGLMDTDGTSDSRGNCEFSQKVGGPLGWQVHILMRSLGYKSRAKVHKATLYGRDMGERWRVFVNPDKGDPVFRSPRKLSRVQNKTNSDRDDKKKFFIKSIEPAGEEMVNCIQVEGGMYLAGQDLIPTHNSELAARKFPSYAIGKNPLRKISISSYGADLAEGFNKDVQSIIEERMFANVFGDDIRLPNRQDRTASRSGKRVDIMFRPDWNPVKWSRGGYVVAAGVGGPLTGKTVDIAIIDDPVKDRESADSVTIRDATWNWYNDVLSTRLHNDASQIVIQTRWHEDDLSGRLIARQGIYSKDNPGGWYLVVFPAIRTADLNSYDPREEGEALWPERHSRERIMEIKASSVVTFDALYQQDPKPNKETLIYGNWKEIEEFPDYDTLDTIFYGLDFGFTNDPTALIRIGKRGRKIFLEEVIYEKGLGAYDLRKRMVEKGVETYRNIYADHEPAMVKDLKYAKDEDGNPLPHESFNILKAEKSIYTGIVNVKSYDVYYTKASHNIKNEKNKYAWKYVGGVNTNEPIDRHNHCFTGDTLITTIEGQKRIGQICVDDLVLTSQGFRKVNKVFDNGVKDIKYYIISFSDGVNRVSATPDHLFKTSQGWKKVSDIVRGDVLFRNRKILGVMSSTVLSVEERKMKPERVYDIEVDDMHEYFANGILVHNCADAVRYGVHTQYHKREFENVAPVVYSED